MGVHNLWFVDGIEWLIDNNSMGVVNMSMGGDDTGAPILDDAEDLILELSDIHFLGIFAAAGNDSISASNFFPANIPDIFTVGATNILDSIASYSNYGTLINIMAPGGDDPSTGGVPILSAGISSDTDVDVPNWGTSMATPHVTGTAAIVRPTVNFSNLYDEIIDNATSGELSSSGLNGSPNLLLYERNTWISETSFWWFPFYNATQLASAESEGWFWTVQTGWVFITESNYPYIFFSSDNEYHYYSENTGNPAWFYNFQTSSWEPIYP